MLVVLSGLPGVGKTTVARAVARRLRATHLSVDSVEDALLAAGLDAGWTTGVAAYAAVAAAATQNLLLGATVVVDAVNDSEAARGVWRRAADGANVKVSCFVLTPPPTAEHQRRLSSRRRGFRHVAEPTWSDVADRARHYEPWGDAVQALDAAASVDELANRVVAALRDSG